MKYINLFQNLLQNSNWEILNSNGKTPLNSLKAVSPATSITSIPKPVWIGEGRAVECCLPDFSKASDAISHDILIDKVSK